MLRYCGIMAPNVEGAVTRARDSARPAARRPGPRGRAGPVSVLRRPQQRLRGGEHARFVSEFVKRPELDPRTAFMTKGDGAGERAGRGHHAREQDGDFCVRQEGLKSTFMHSFAALYTTTPSFSDCICLKTAQNYPLVRLRHSTY